MPVTTRIITFLVRDPYKPSFATVTGRGDNPKNTCVLRHHVCLQLSDNGRWPLHFASTAQQRSKRLPVQCHPGKHKLCNGKKIQEKTCPESTTFRGHAFMHKFQEHTNRKIQREKWEVNAFTKSFTTPSGFTKASCWCGGSKNLFFQK